MIWVQNQIRLKVLLPAIGVAKELIRVQTTSAGPHPITLVPGVFEAVYQITVQNNGNTLILDSLVLLRQYCSSMGL